MLEHSGITDRSTELYARWMSVAAERRSDLALFETGSGRRWSFEQLASAGQSNAAAGPLVTPKGQGSDFILSLLAAWRAGATVCPLESTQDVPRFPALPERCAHLKLTSGTTGAAKAVVFTASQLAADARNIVSTMGLRPEWPNLGVISLAHSYGFSNLVLPLLLHGIPLVLAPAPLPETVLAAAREVAALTLPAVPALWRTWFSSSSIPANVRLAISAGAPLPFELEQSVFEHSGLKIHNFYGSTECGGIAYDRSLVPREDSAITGSALENVHLSISESGTLVVRGEAVGETYWPDPSPSLSANCFTTADLVEISAGNVFLRGRLSDLINIAGRKVAPEQIESVLRRHPDIGECVVFGVPNSEHDRFETIVAAVNALRPLSVPRLNAFLSAEIPNWQIPRQWWFTELAANGRGKISRSEWRARYLAQRRI